MHIRFNRALRGDYGRAKVNDIKLVEKDVGKSLVQRGLAVEVEAPPEDETEGGETKPKAKGGKPASGEGGETKPKA